jgi:DnaK suppressor protein
MEEARARELLAAERARIERELAGARPLAEGGGLAHGDQHLADDASDLFDDEEREGLIDGLREELHAVERAEQRLAEGAFGLSVGSGLPIPDERLEARPTAERTVEEEERLERGGARD